VNSTATKYTGAGTVTPPAVGTCSPGQVVLMGACPAPENATGLRIAGFPIAGLPIAGPVGTTGAFPGGTARPSVQITARRDRVVVGYEHTSSTPGDLPPEDPLS